MRLSRVLYEHAARITLFTRPNCSLCITAKSVLGDVKKRNDFEYHELDVMEPENSRWKDVYEFDTPAVHVEPVSKQSTVQADQKLMHRFSADEVHTLIDKIHAV